VFNIYLLPCFPCWSIFLGNAAPGFSGQDSDANPRQTFLRSRYYDPETGTFLTKDPLGISGGLNNYAYCSGDPVSCVDPDGTRTYLVFYVWNTRKDLAYLMMQQIRKCKCCGLAIRTILCYLFILPNVPAMAQALQNNSDIVGMYYYGHGIAGVLTLGGDPVADQNLSVYGGVVKVPGNSTQEVLRR